MRVILPRNQRAIGEQQVVAAYDAARSGYKHSNFRTASMSGPDVGFTLPKMFDPARTGMGGDGYGSWNGGYDLLRFDDDANVRRQVLLAARNIAKTHPLVSAIIEIYSSFPLSGMKLTHSDPSMQRFYEDLFMDDLDFPNFLTDVGRCFWTDGMTFVFGNWSDDLGLFVGEDVLDPIDMDVQRMPLSGTETITMRPSDYMRSVAKDQGPAGQEFRRQFPDLADTVARGLDIAFDASRITYLADKDRPSDLYGSPRILRCWNTLRLESRMNSAMQATADRLYAPLMMFTIGGTLPNGDRFIPPASALDAFRDNLDAALSSDFRAIITHDGVHAQRLIDGDRMNNFKSDWDMYDERIFTAWGLSSSVLKPESTTYATGALEFKLAAQLMTRFQHKIRKVYENQAAIVAEAHRHYERDEGTGEVVTERREVWDEDAGEYKVIECPRLSFPTLQFSPVDFTDRQRRREFLAQMRQQGMQISDEDIMVDVNIDLDESRRRFNEEQVQRSVDEARRQASVFSATVGQSLPVPPDTKSYMDGGVAPLRFKSVMDAYDSTEVPGTSSAPSRAPSWVGGMGSGTGPEFTPSPTTGLEDETGVRGAPEESFEEE